MKIDGYAGQAHGCLARSVLIMPPSAWRCEHEYSSAVAPHGLHVVGSQIWAVVARGVGEVWEGRRSRADASGLLGSGGGKAAGCAPTLFGGEAGGAARKRATPARAL